MKIRYIGKSDSLELLNGKTYDLLNVEDGWYRIVDERGEACLCPPEAFEIVKSTQALLCHDCGKRLPGAGIAVTDNNSRQRQVCEYCARFYKD
jgi:hypothetical protein